MIPRASRPAKTERTSPRPPSGLTILRVVHPFPTLLVTTLTVALIPLADRDSPLSRYLILGAAMFCFQCAIGVTNDIADLDEDRARPDKRKPFALGLLRRETAVLLAAGLSGGGLLASITLPFGAWLIGLAGLVCGLTYDLWLKRTPLSWLPYALALPLVPAWVFTAAEAWEPLLWWAFPVGLLLGASLNLANQLPDLSPSSTGRRQGLPSAVGRSRSGPLALALFGAAASLAAVVLAFESAVAAALVALSTIATLLSVCPALRAAGPRALFPTLAVGSAAMAAVFVAAA